MQTAEDVFLARYSADVGTWKSGLELAGFQYFAYRDLQEELRANATEPVGLPIVVRDWPEAANVHIGATGGVRFGVSASDADADLAGVEWYLGERVEVQRRRGHEAAFSYFQEDVPEDGLRVSVIPFDAKGHYGNVIEWKVVVRR